MLYYHILILALIQGITEFLPISSSGHLVLTHGWIEGDINQVTWKSDQVVLDVAVHMGTLFSVLLYFRKDLTGMGSGIKYLFLKKAPSGEKRNSARLAGYILAASLPVLFAGLALHLASPDWVRSVHVVAWATLIFGVLLGLADMRPVKHPDLTHMRFPSAIIIGLAQILALVPGTSRSGITMTAARFCGFSRTDSARFSLYLAIIAILGAGTLSMIDLISKGDIRLGLDALTAAVLAFVSGWLAIAAMMCWLEKASFWPFVIYRIVLGTILLALIGYHGE